MKKFFFFAVALTVMASCTNETIVDGSPLSTTNNDGAISFSSVYKGATRADHVGADAADLLNNKFVVGGFKINGSSVVEVFDNYIVNWTTNTAGKTTSNTSDWEYVGVTAAAPSAITGAQTIKYWDYNTTQYDFAAYSTGTATVITSGSPSTGQVKVTEITHATPYAGLTYTLQGARDDLAKCYVSDMVTAYVDGTDAAHPYQGEVSFVFRNMASKVRVALYETIPGYSVKDVYFYQDASTAVGTDITANTSATLFTTGSGTTDKFYTAGTYTVSFPTIGKSNYTSSATDYNKAHVAFTADTEGATTKQAFGTLNYGPRHDREAVGDDYLGISSATATFAGTATPWYTTVLPNETGAVLELRVDYTLLSVDGSGETITVHGATAYIPAIYAAWKPNYAYTYIFKISDNTNGWTNAAGTYASGLYPITFDAVVVDSEEHTQSTITNVASPSITTYQLGHNYSDNEYLAASGDIYVQVMNDGVLATDLTTAGISSLYTLSGLTNPTEADVMDALNIQAGTTSTTITGRNGLTLTTAGITNNITAVPGPDGNDIVVTSGTAAKFTPAAGTYAYVYYTGTDNTDTNIYSAITLTSDDAPADWTGNYWDNPNGTGSAVTTYVKDKTYYRHYSNLNKVYGVKVIKVN